MNNYRIKKEKERLLLSTVYVLGSTALVFLLLFILGLFKFEDFNEYSGPVKITFGSPLSEITDNVVKPKEIVSQETVKEPVPELPKSEETTTIPKNESIKNTVPEKKEPLNKSSEIADNKVTSEEPKQIVQSGRESGNSHETTFDSDSSKIGRRAYFPIAQFMPLPNILTDAVYNSVSGDITGFDDPDYNRNLIDKFYSKNLNNYVLVREIPLQDRPYLWAIIEKAGYDLNKAEYKLGTKLKDVIIAFEINGNSNGANAIKSAEVITSSGNKEIDEAVLYGFKQSTYSNSTDEIVKGRFKYTFN